MGCRWSITDTLFRSNCNSGNNHVANLTFVSSDRGTFITSGAITVTGDEIASNNANQFRMRVYPDTYTRTIYDRGDNLVDTYIGWGPTGTTPFKAGVRFTAASEIKLLVLTLFIVLKI